MHQPEPTGPTIAALVADGYLKPTPPTSSLHMQRLGRIARGGKFTPYGSPEPMPAAMDLAAWGVPIFDQGASNKAQSYAAARALETMHGRRVHHVATKADLLYHAAKAMAAMDAGAGSRAAPWVIPVIDEAHHVGRWSLAHRRAPTFTPLPGARVRTPGLDDGSPL